MKTTKFIVGGLVLVTLLTIATHKSAMAVDQKSWKERITGIFTKEKKPIEVGEPTVDRKAAENRFLTNLNAIVNQIAKTKLEQNNNKKIEGYTLAINAIQNLKDSLPDYLTGGVSTALKQLLNKTLQNISAIMSAGGVMYQAGSLKNKIADYLKEYEEKYQASSACNQKQLVPYCALAEIFYILLRNLDPLIIAHQQPKIPPTKQQKEKKRVHWANEPTR